METSANRIKRHQQIYDKPIEEQFEVLFIDDKANGKIFVHLLANKNASDYEEVFNVAIAFAKSGESVEILPEIADKETLKYRHKIFTNYPPYLLKNPDLRVNGIYLDIKRPESIKNITKNANSASLQGAIAVISDCRLNKKIDASILIKRALAIFNIENRKNYTPDELYFFVDGELIKYNRD